MTEAQFVALKPGDVIENELGWRYIVKRPGAAGWILKAIPGTGREQHLRGSAKTGKALTARAWSKV